MKRSFDKIETINEVQDCNLKRPREEENEITAVELMDCSDKSNTSAQISQYGATLVERESNPAGYSLLNAGHVGKKDYTVLTELQTCIENAADFTEANVKNQIDMIGQQMKYLQNSLQSVIGKFKQNNELHKAACNFVKKPGNTYHLYERSTGQRYFSMLSPLDWNDNPPHKFLGSWYLEADQSWTPAEQMHLRYPGINYLKEMYTGRFSIQ
ncbi:hypothetical protein GWI33_000306 [Rhynchophorus ferrugineus]|uniref:DUF2452 domain-containing protein n=1 Tax=Rhynchophorus ferrugineus TaxID=354439 RepID=A0A834HMP0_RHYFE|nr:hypothetical protein GWI33_000306 [Rhynchophorus ferrugineus]